MNQNKFIITAMVVIVAAALIASAMSMPAFAIVQHNNGKTLNGSPGENHSGGHGQNGGVGGDGTNGNKDPNAGQNGGNNCIPAPC